MRHGKKFNHLSRPTAHRKALLINLAKALILHKRINTTVAKAKALRKFVEPILTKTKKDTMHSRRVVFSYFQDKEPVKELFNNIAEKIADRPGGYTRIIKLGNRLGDNAEMCMIELVDYNNLLQKEAKSSRNKTRRGRRKAKATDSSTTTPPQSQEKVAPEPISANSEKPIAVDAEETHDAQSEVNVDTTSEDREGKDSSSTPTEEEAPEAT